MMKTTLSTLALAAALAVSTGALAQVPSGGADAKGNAPLKHAHTVNDGAAKAGRSSFTERQAQRHIEHAGYTSVTGLTKGRDGVWRGTATKDGTPRPVGLDFKGNVSEGSAADAGGARTLTESTTTRTTTGADSGAGATSAGAGAAEPTDGSTHRRAHHHRHHRHHRHHAAGRCASANAEGAACSGVDRNRNGISDKEDRRTQAGAPR